MQTENFSLNHINSPNLSMVEARIYIDKYFIPLDNGTHAVLKNGTYTIIETSVLEYLL
jgi:hypothetical protein